MAPGVDITSTSSAEGQYTQMSGTSVATAFVTGTIALLWSIFPNVTASQMIYSVRKSNSSSGNTRRSIIPPMLNAEMVRRTLKAAN
jgi:subtilisin family serine protease